MDGEEIIKRLEKIQKLIKDNSIKDAQLQINYLVDDIFLYRKSCL